MNYEVIIEPQAEIDIREATGWYERQREGLGDEFLESLDETLDRIGRLAGVYAVVRRNVRAVMMRTISLRRALRT